MSDFTPRSAVERTLVDYLAGRVTYAEFVRLMAPHAEIDIGWPSGRVHYRHPLDAQVPLRPADLYPVLEEFVAGGRSALEVSRWVQLIDIMTEYGPGADAPDEEADRLEPMWDVLAELSTRPPEALTLEVARDALARLRRFEVAFARGAV